MAEAGSVSFTALGACIAGILFFQFLISSQKLDATLQGVACRENLHVQRKLQHLGTGVMTYGAVLFFDRWISAWILLFFALLLFGVHKLREYSKTLDAGFIQCFSNILRQYEVSRTALPGAYYFLLGSGFSVMFFPLRVARLAILSLSVGDPAAAFFGTIYGRHKLVNLIGPLGGNKSLEGSIGCFCVTSAATFTSMMMEQDFYFNTESTERTVVAGIVSLTAGAGAAAAELLDVGGWDDNLTLPLLSGLFLQLTLGFLL